jgi:hypothetical protein
MKSWFQVSCGRYVVTMLVSLVLYAAVLVVSLKWLQAGATSPGKYFVAVLPVLPAFGVLLAVVQRCRAMDEMELRTQLEAVSISFVATAIATFTYGFLQNAGLPEVSWVWVWPVMCVCWIVGTVIAKRRYR